MRRGKRGYSSKPMSKQILRDSLAVRRLLEVNPSELKDDVIAINRVTKVVKGGKNLSFSALVVVGDSHGHAGFGMGKAREVPMAIKQGIEQAKKKSDQAEPEGYDDSAPGFGTLRLGASAAQARVGRHGRHRRRPGAQGDASRGDSQRADEIDRHVESAQRRQGRFCGAPRLEGYSARGGNALEDGGRNQRQATQGKSRDE